MAAVDSFELLCREISRSCSYCYETLALFGALYTASKAAGLLRDCCMLVRVHFIPRMIANKKLTQRYGDWAVVQGAWEPVAQAYTEELARQGFSVVIIAQETAAVADFAAFLSLHYGVETTVIPIGVSLEPAATKSIKEVLRGKDIGVLVNCVDESSASLQNLVEVPEEMLLGLVRRNIAAATLMARLVLPGMVGRGRGAMVNVSSGAGCRPRSGRATLSATVGYLDNFSRALQLEYGSRGIVVQNLIPFQITSNKNQPSGWFAPHPEVYAHHAISTLGVSSRTTGYWPHTLQYGLMRCVPDWIWVLGSLMFFNSS